MYSISAGAANAKTSAAVTEAAIDAVRRHHSYDTPEVVALPVTAGLPAYLQWIAAETRAG